MTRSSATIPLAWMLALAAGGVASAGTILDQDYGPSHNAFGPVNRDGDRAQTFTLGITGILCRVDISVSRRDGTVEPLWVDVRATEGAVPVEPDSPVLATGTVPASSVPSPSPAFVSADLSASNLFVTAGEVLALVLRTDSRISNQANLDYAWAGSSNELYDGGDQFARSCLPGTGCRWLGPFSIDLKFRTFVPEPHRSLLDATALLLLASIAALARCRRHV